MYLVTRTRAAEPTRFREAMKFATDIRDFVNANTDLEVSAHLSVFGRPVGTFMWATFVEGRGTFADASVKLLGDPRYLELLDAGGPLFQNLGDDVLRQVVHIKGASETDPRPAFSQGWAAQVRDMKFDQALAWAVDITDYVSELTGVGLALLADGYGDFGTITWLARLDSAKQADAVNEKMMNDAEWRKRVAEAAELFIDGRTRVWLNRTLP